MADFKYLIETFRYGKTIGSLLKVKRLSFAHLQEQLNVIDRTHIQDVFGTDFQGVVIPEMKRLLSLAEVLSAKYDVMITNPPYIGTSAMEDSVKKYAIQFYPNSKTDMFAMFMETAFVKQNGFLAMINMHSWMFLASYEQLRKTLLSTKTIISMAHLGARAFDEIGGEVVQTTSFILRNAYISRFKGLYSRLVYPSTQNGKENMFLDKHNLYFSSQDDYSKIVGAPIAYNFPPHVFKEFSSDKPLSYYGITRLGMTTANNNLFVRLWNEVEFPRICLHAKNADEVIGSRKKWVPYNKGGSFRRWFGNNDCIVNWENNGYAIKHYGESEGHIRSTVPNTEYYFRDCITWSKISAGKIALRYREQGSIFDVAGACLYATKREVLNALNGFMNSCVAQYFLTVLSPTMNFEGGQIATLPISDAILHDDSIGKIVEENISLSKDDWDVFETSWDFKRHPLAFDPRLKEKYKNSQWAEDRISKCSSLSWLYENWEKECQYRFDQLKANEEELNRIFIDIYGLQAELTPEVEDKDVTVRLADKERDVKSLISYLIGIIMGRYSLDVDGLAYAGGAWDASKYRTYQPDDDGIVPIYDGIGMQDGLTAKICELLKVVYGERFYKANIDFIADALGKAQNESSEETLNRYLNNGFYTDHLKTYQKRPIYWMLSSGKNSGFKCLVYMHRYNADTLARVNGKYFLPESTRLKNELDELQIRIRDAEGREKIRLEKTRQKVAAAYNEAIEYGQALDHMANQYIAIDLDDGVKVNYAKFQGVEMVTDSGTKVKKDLLVPIK